MVSQEPIAIEGRNCWRRAHANRVTFLVDAAAYFDAFAAAVDRARESILITGWDIDSRVRLRCDPARRQLPNELGRLLDTLVSRRPDLHAYVIDWDYAMLYAFEREQLPLLKLGKRTHPRLHFRLDGNHPGGASHHQKLVVIDDCVAFSGGLDLTARRWDTPEHLAQDPRRIDPWGKPYRPFHDVQIMVDGEAAAALGDIVRERWERLTGERPRPPTGRYDHWPATVAPDVEDVRVAIARTDPPWQGRPEVREVEQLWLDSIAAARRFLYIETQYLTSQSVGEALAKRLEEPDGPEVVIVCTLENVGWLEEATMGVLRARLLRRLRAADRHHRLRVVYPVVAGIEKDFVKMHSKVLVVDDRLARVGSANLNNRSMGLDTECDLAVESEGDARVARSITAFRDRLVGEHLGVSSEAVGESISESGSLVATLDRFQEGDRSLIALDGVVPEWLDRLIPDAAVVDPERPIDSRRFIDEVIGPEVREHAHRPFLRGVLILLGALLLALAWQWGPLARSLDPGTIVAWLEPLRESPLAPLAVVAGYVVGGLAVFPVTVLILSTVLVFGPIHGLLYALVGSLLSAAVTYAIGRALGRDLMRRLASPRVERVRKRLARGGALPVAAVRAVPVAPFTVVNLLAGASRIPFRPYLVGTAAGMLPGMLALTALGAQIAATLRDPGIRSLIVLGVVAAALFVASLWLRRRTRGRDDDGAEAARA